MLIAMGHRGGARGSGAGTAARSGGKGEWWGGRHYPPDQIGTAVQMVYTGSSFRKAAEFVQVMRPDDAPRISPQTVRLWVLRYTGTVMELLRETKVPGRRRWLLWIFDVPNSALAWLMVNADTGYIISHSIQQLGEAVLGAQAIVRGALAASNGPPDSVTYCGSWTLGGRLMSVGHGVQVPNVLRQELPKSTEVHVQRASHKGGGDRDHMLELGAAFHKALRKIRQAQWLAERCHLHRRLGSHAQPVYRQEWLDGRTPAEVVGVTAPFNSWAEVVRIGARARIPQVDQHSRCIDLP